MNSPRVIARLDIKNNFVVKGIQFEGWEKIGNPIELAIKYYTNGADELVFIDNVSSLFSQKSMLDILKNSLKKIFIPIGIGGGIKKIEDAKKILFTGADKIIINTAFLKNPNLIKLFVNTFGSQSIILSIQAKKFSNSTWMAYMEAGRENGKKEVLKWIKEAESLGVGELLVTSIDNEGLKKGLDLELYKKIKKITNLPIIAGGGFNGSSKDINSLKSFNLSGISIARLFHENKITPNKLKIKINENK